MKKGMFILFLVAALILIPNVKAEGNDIISSIDPESNTETITPRVGSVNGDVYYQVDVSWGDMTFDYELVGTNDYRWIPTEVYNRYTATYDKTNYVLVDNNSNVDVQATISWTPTITGVVASYYDYDATEELETDRYTEANTSATLSSYEVSETGQISGGPDVFKRWYVFLTGGAIENVSAGATIGTITVTLSEPVTQP